ncbi:MAG: hypothetical protein Q8P50_08945 [Bacillota bacterium]|nr:hypothetical protein [Bacillota bacterium]
MASVTFRNLLEQATNNSNGTDITALEGERDKAKGEVEKLEGKLQGATQRLREVELKLDEPIRQAVKAAGLLTVPIPPEYQAQVRQSTRRKGGGKGKGSYLWEPGALPGSTKEDLKAKTCEVSWAMWAYSRGSSGAAGRQGEGVLIPDAFWTLVKEQTGKGSLEPGESVEITLPNGRPLKVTRISPVER